MSDILETIFKRRSIRSFTDQPVPREMLVDLLKAAMAAPSAANHRPWEFVVLTEPQIVADLKDVLPYAKFNAPAVIVVSGRPEQGYTESGGNYWVQDCSAAIENMLIAAVGMGLGTVWTGIYPIQTRVADVRRVLGIPETAVPLAAVLVGYPAEAKPARTQYNEARVHWEQY
ncbi:MAG: nitroreductase family protein [Anaerolineaceae bacterium]|nr:nitroreductase family protein [Anaerolineaceae bacterium]